ncbi:CDP-diacylglycerol--glycerol-3-phosphate 3-phosphatidyltransferase 2-like [Abrus precatorius]|uniref:CDP-diacylglycerol--glycerol-3-phosphate 1-phosphatidyltransferase n=1 Tax=Abrus precatorius TaxID=3816 RepID=A0A8B8M8W6_ABRPR|nr:CDP-diacylglycerol--glycerol-3-phosphate 3-phosphatidyltransferase 2-like [Abrus precatorius]
MMSSLKLSATASIYYMRKATTKPLLWTPNRNRTIQQRYMPSHSPSKSKTLSFPIRDRLGCLGKAGIATDLGSTVPSQPQPHPQPEPPKLLTLPTILTLGRVAAVPILVATFYMDGWRGTAATTSIFVAASLTDWLDGYIARRMKLKSSFGAFLDPVADKLMVAATLVLLCTRPLGVAAFGQAPWLLTLPSIAIIGREITMSAVREWAASKDSKLLEAVAVNNLGKWKTATQMTALTILLATRDWSHGGAAIVVGSGVVLLYTSAGLAIWSLVVYMRKIWKALLR